MSHSLSPRSGAQGAGPDQIHSQDVDDIIGIAARMKQANAERLTVEELEEVARDLDIEPQYVAQAVETLRRRRADAQAREAAQRARRRKIALGAAVAAAAVAVIVGAMAMIGRSGLSERLAAVRAQHAQVVNVMERQRQVDARLAGQPQTPDRQAEMLGSENRVRVETKRYNQAASAYNERVSSLTGGLALALFDLPERVPMAHEVSEW